jgi:hypothetical protein
MTTGAPVVHGRGVVAAGDGAERGPRRDPGRHAVVGAVRGADHRHGARRPPAALPHGRGLQGRRGRQRHGELLGARRLAAALRPREEALPDRGRRRRLRRLPRRGPRDQEGHHHQEGGEGEVAAAVAQALCRRVPEVQPARGRGKALQHELPRISQGTARTQSLIQQDIKLIKESFACSELFFYMPYDLCFADFFRIYVRTCS